MKAFRYMIPLYLLVALFAIKPAWAADPPFPDYIQKAQTLLVQAETKSSGMNEFSDDLLIGKNYLRNAEVEFKKNLSWGGKLDTKAEPTVRYYAAMAQLQAAVILSRIEKIVQEQERAGLDEQIAAVKARIKVFDDKVAEIAVLKAEIVKRDAASKDEVNKHEFAMKDLGAQLTSRKAEIELLNTKITTLTADLAARTSSLETSESNRNAVSRELDAQKLATVALEKKIAELTASLESSGAETRKLRGDLAALATQKGVVESQSREQIEVLNRQNEFVAEIGKLGGVIKSGSDNMTVIFARSDVIKAPKNDILTVEGDKAVARIVDLLKKYPEFRLKLKVHGFGQPSKNEDAAATDRMARMMREALLEKGKFDPAAVEALGAGVAEPINLKTNPEGNRRIEISFVKKPVK